METQETKSKPRQLSEEEIKKASEGRSEEVMGKGQPIQLSEKEVKEASEGKSEEVMKRKERKEK